MLDFLFGRMFFWDVLFVGFVVSACCPKRSFFGIRAVGAVILCTLCSCGWSALFPDMNESSIALMEEINYLGAFIIVMGILSACIKFSRWTLLYMGSAVWFIQHTASCIDMGILSWEYGLAGFAAHVIVLLSVTLLVWFLFIRRLEYHILIRIKLDMAVPVWVMVCLMCLILHSYASAHQQNTLAFYLADMLTCVSCLFCQYCLYRFSGQEYEKESLALLLQQNKKQYESAKDSIEAVNIKCHDLRHQIRGFRNAGKVDENALQEMEQAIDTYDAMIKTGNPALDIILTEKSMACKNRGIGFTCMAEGSGISYLEPSDLYALFGNALDNAIEATEVLPDPDKKQISLTVRRIEDFYSVHLQNYTQHRLVMAGGLPQTSKENKLEHGFGARSMQLLVEKYGGEITFYQDGDVVNVYLLLPCRAPET